MPRGLSAAEAADGFARFNAAAAIEDGLKLAATWSMRVARVEMSERFRGGVVGCMYTRREESVAFATSEKQTGGGAPVRV